MGKETLTTRFGELDKLTGQLYLQEHDLPVPPILKDWAEAQIDPRGLTVDYFLQKVVPRSEVRIITLDAGRGQIMVNCMEMGNPTE